MTFLEIWLSVKIDLSNGIQPLDSELSTFQSQAAIFRRSDICHQASQNMSIIWQAVSVTRLDRAKVLQKQYMPVNMLQDTDNTDLRLLPMEKVANLILLLFVR